MRKLILSVLCAIGFITVAAATYARGEKKSDRKMPIVTREYTNLGSFTGLKASSGFDVDYTVGPATKVIVEVPETILQYVTVKVVEGKLSIGLDNKSHKINNFKKLRAIVTGPVLNDVATSSSADINIMSPMSVENGSLVLSASSSGDIDFKYPVNYKNVTVSASSSADIELEGLTTSSLTIKASSSADVSIANLKAENVIVTASSSSDIKLSGTAANASFEASSSADISAGNLKVASGSAKASSSGDIVCSVKNFTFRKSSGGSVKNK